MEHQRCEKVKNGLKNIGALVAGATLAGTVLGLTGLAIYFPTQTASELFMDKARHEYVATLKKKGYLQMAQTKGIMDYGDFETPDGKKFRLYDSARILEGKIFPNTKMHSLEEGFNYRLISVGSENYQTILDAR